MLFFHNKRSLFHLIKRLGNRIVKEPSKTSNGSYTNIIRLSKYVSNTKRLTERICEVLEYAPNNIAARNHLLRATGSSGKRFTGTLQKLIAEGYLDRVEVNGQNCLQLIKSYNKDKIAYTPEIVGVGQPFADVPLESQVYNLVELSGERGMNSAVCMY